MAWSMTIEFARYCLVIGEVERARAACAVSMTRGAAWLDQVAAVARWARMALPARLVL